MIVSDAIVIWRAWALFPTQKWMMAFPVALLFGSFGKLTVAFGRKIDQNRNFAFTGVWIAVASNAHSTNVMITVDGFLAYLSLSLAANVITTILIGWKLWFVD